MKNQIFQFTLGGLIAATLIASPISLQAADKPAKPAASEAPIPPPPQIVRQPFRGKVESVDTAKMTLTVGSQVVHVTSETKISKAGKPATLSEIVVGDMVGGSAKKDEAGNLNAAIIRVGEIPKFPKQPKKADQPGQPPQ